jgi:hypothetical protein
MRDSAKDAMDEVEALLAEQGPLYAPRTARHAHRGNPRKARSVGPRHTDRALATLDRRTELHRNIETRPGFRLTTLIRSLIDALRR